MLGMNGGELFLVCFIAIAVVTARLWQRVGAAVGEWLAGGQHDRGASPAAPESKAGE